MAQKEYRIVVIGAGYVGLVTASCLAQKGHHVVLVEIDSAKSERIKKGEVPFFEPGLSVVLRNSITQKRMQITTSLENALAEKPEVVFSCVGTPSFPDGAVDLSYVWKVVSQVGSALVDDILFVHKSTVPVGVTRKSLEMLRTFVQQRGLNCSVEVASNPEFLSEGNAVSDFMRPSRVVCGVSGESAPVILRDIYSDFIEDKNLFLEMDLESAELTKYASNTMLATRISFINEIARLADRVGADMAQVARGVGSDVRIGKGFLRAGVGYGGSCLPKDVQALSWMGRLNGEAMNLIQMVGKINVEQRERFVEKIAEHFGSELVGKRAGVWGLSFKPNTDDMREAPAISIITELLKKNVDVCAYDPHVCDKSVFPDNLALSFAKTPREVLEASDFLIILTEWEEFSLFTPIDFALLSDRTVFDGRNCFDPCEMIASGITYFCIGRNLFIKSRAGGKKAGVPRVEISDDTGRCNV
ncbi:UDP-glucose/GDP-mannose dehydrogenase family protein [Candidatus Babeliales bacterium]|nr:UDP-glucose/GDP-mannose dehydrogenase family protein [Candidatus Babeliales bacterium]